VITCASDKGGVGKTSLSVTLAVELAASRRVLLVDADPRADATVALGIRPGDPRWDDGAGVVELLAGGEVRDVSAAWREPWEDGSGIGFAREKLRVLPGGRHVERFAATAAGERDEVRARLAAWDVVVVDSPPGDRRMQSVVLSLADDVYVPVEADLNVIRGLHDIVRVVADVGGVGRPRLAGVVLYRLPQSASALRREAREDVAEALGGVAPVLDAVVRASVEYPRAVRVGLSPIEWAEYVTVTDGFSAAKQARALAWDFRCVVDEIIGGWT
jgi:chromosome partitioning protein